MWQSLAGSSTSLGFLLSWGALQKFFFESCQSPGPQICHYEGQGFRLHFCYKLRNRQDDIDSKIGGIFAQPVLFVFFGGGFFLIPQETGTAGLAGVFWPSGMELAKSEVSLFLCIAGSIDHLEDVEGFANGSSGLLGRVSRLLLKRSWVLVSSSMVASSK